MVAGILENDKMIYEVAGGKPWHPLGKAVIGMSPEEMYREVADWEVKSIPSVALVGHQMVQTGQNALVRMDTKEVLSNVGPNWNPVQNKVAFDFFGEFVNEAKNMTMETAGTLMNGRYVWALAKMNEPIVLANGKEEFQPYLLFSNPHMYGNAVNVKFLMTRVVCWNTLSWGISEYSENQVRMNHQQKFDPQMVKIALGLAENKSEVLGEKIGVLTNSRYDEEELDRFLIKVFGKNQEGNLTRTGEKVKAEVETSPGHDIFPGTWWNALNAVTYYTDHLSGKDETRLKSQWFGSNGTKKVKALDLALEMAS